jgi:hypothetical protein
MFAYSMTASWNYLDNLSKLFQFIIKSEYFGIFGIILEFSTSKNNQIIFHL